MKIFFSLIALTQIALLSLAQVGIQNNNPLTTLDIRGVNHNGALVTGDGLLVPRVDTIGVNGLEKGQLIYLIDDEANNGFKKGFHFWDGNAWSPISSSATTAASGNGQIFTGYWFIGNVTSGNTTISDLSGNISSVTHNGSLSTGSNSTYDIVMDDDYLVGRLGVDFQIVTELTSDKTDTSIRNDTQAHRVVEVTGENSFRLTLSNQNSGSDRTIGVSIAVVRHSGEGTLFNRAENIGVYNELNDLTTAFPNPTRGFKATITNHDATLVHIFGNPVPAGEEEYYLYYDGADWVYLGWSNSTSVTNPWTVDPAGWIINATGSGQPSKATTPDMDLVRYRELANNWVEVEMIYAADSNSGSAQGSGDYLITLPNNYQFDPSEHPTFTGNGAGSNSIATAYSLQVNQSITAQNNNAGSEIIPIPFNGTQFRMLTYSGASPNDYIRNGFYEMTRADKVLLLRFFFKRL